MDFQTIINAITPELITLVLSAAVAGGAYLYQWGVQRLPANMRTQIQALADTAVQAIEQKYAGQSSPGGPIKKQEAMQMLGDICKSLGLPLDQAHASAAIEAAVYGINLFQPKQTTASQPTKAAG